MLLPSRKTPLPVLPEIRFTAPAAVPPILRPLTKPLAPMPWLPFGIAAVPVRSVPM